MSKREAWSISLVLGGWVLWMIEAWILHTDGHIFAWGCMLFGIVLKPVDHTINYNIHDLDKLVIGKDVSIKTAKVIKK